MIRGTSVQRSLAPRSVSALDCLPVFGRGLLAVPMLAFGVLHFVFADFVATIVPSWISWHYFWTYFTGIALFAAGAAILSLKYVQVASFLLGVMILLFVLLIHSALVTTSPAQIPINSPFGGIAGRWNNCFKDLGLCGSAFLCAATLPGAPRIGSTASVLGRAIFALSIFGFGVMHFVYPEFAPGIPPMFTTIAFPLPGQFLWVYLTGAGFLAAGAGIALRREPPWCGAALGVIIFVFILLVWVPRFPAHPGERYGNWLKDLGIAGGAWILTGLSHRSDRLRHQAT